MNEAIQLEWFYQACADLVDNPAAVEAAIAERTRAGTPPLEQALALYLMGRLALQSGHYPASDDAHWNALAGQALAVLRETLDHSAAGQVTWILAAYTAALRLANLFLKRDDIARLTGGIKNHVYANAIRNGTLMASGAKTGIDHHLLLASVPFGLFEPEDLVLVEAVRDLAETAGATAEDRLLLAWYYAEQGSYERSRTLLAQNSNYPLRNTVHQILARAGELSGRFILHRPHGNANRYEPLFEERFPKHAGAGETIVIRARSMPHAKDDPIELVIGETVIPMQMTPEGWQAQVPAPAAGTALRYRFRFTDTPDIGTEEFVCPLLGTCIFVPAAAARTDKSVVLFAADATLTVSLNAAGTPVLDIQPGAAEIPPGAVAARRQSHFFGDYAFEIELNPFSVRITRNGQVLADTRPGALRWRQNADGTVHDIAWDWAMPPCGVYGLGERYNALSQYGERVDQFVYNQYKDQGLRTYMPMPVFYTDRQYGLHIDTDHYSWFDFAKAASETLSFGTEGARLRLHLLAGDVASQVGQFIGLTGTPERVPDWALGPWMSSNNWDSDAEVRRQVELTKYHGIPATVLVIEAWSDEATFYIFNDATYDETDGITALDYSDFRFPDWGRWPDPRDLVEHLHENDLKCILWQIPIVKQVTSLAHIQKSRDEAAMIANGYAVGHADGTPYRLPEGWFKDSLLIDFTNPEATEWWFSKRNYLLDLGVDGFKTDGGECVFGNDLVFADGSSGAQMRNRYPRDYISAYYDFTRRNDGMTFSRSGYTGAQQFPAHWAGDERSTWDAFGRSLKAGLSAGLSGVIFWGWDLGGFSGPIPSAELYIRSAQMACFCPIMQYHAESKAQFNQDRTPWNIAERTEDERALSVYRYFANLRMTLLPYLSREADHCVATATPLMRPMFLDYHDNPAFAECWDQYMLGRDLLVAPIIEQGAVARRVSLPEGRWWHLFEHRWYDSRDVQVAAGLGQIPVFVREGAVVPLAFGTHIELGAAMPSNIDRFQHPVALVTGTLGNAADLETGGITVSVSGDAGRGYKITTSGPARKPVTIIFADRPVDVTVNNAGRNLTELPFGDHPVSAIIL